MNVCVLGATGFIGGQIARAAVGAGWKVRAVRRNLNNVGAIGDLPVQWVLADLRDVSTLVTAMQGCEVLFHAAGAYPQDFRHITQAVASAKAEMYRILDSARSASVRRVIYTSSLTTLAQPAPRPNGEGQGVEMLTESHFYKPGTADSAYYEAKFAMEQIALAVRERNFEVVTLLPTAVFGPGDIKPTTSVVIRDAAQGKFPVYFDATINAVDGRDVAASHIAAVEKGGAGERYILGGHNLTLYEVLATVMRAVGKSPPRIKLSRALVKRAIALADALPGVSIPENMRMFEFWGPCSSAKAERELGHTARPFEETVRDTLAWFGITAAASASPST
jgi:dihydroflavonol-4-reductase